MRSRRAHILYVAIFAQDYAARADMSNAGWSGVSSDDGDAAAAGGGWEQVSPSESDGDEGVALVAVAADPARPAAQRGRPRKMEGPAHRRRVAAEQRQLVVAERSRGEAARQALAQKRARQRDDAFVFMGAAFRPVGGGQFSQPFVDALALRAPRREENDSRISKIIAEFLGDRPRMGMPLCAEARMMQVNRRSLNSDSHAVASGVYRVSHMLASSFASRLIMLKRTRQLQILACVTGLMYDETPLRMRIGADDHKLLGIPGTDKETALLKLVQSEFQLGIVVQGAATGHKPVILMMELPCRLRTLDHATGENLRRCLKEEAQLDMLPNLRAECVVNVDISVADRCSANLKAERGSNMKHILGGVNIAGVNFRNGPNKKNSSKNKKVILRGAESLAQTRARGCASLHTNQIATSTTTFP